MSDQDGKSTAVSVGQKIYEGQTINSGPESEVHIVTEDGGIIAIRPDTVFRVDEYKAEGSSSDKIFMSLLTGAVRSITGWIGKHDTSAYRLTAPGVTLGIRGTDHEVTVIDKGDGDEPGTYDTVNEGATVLKTPHGEAEVSPGKFAFAPKGRAVAPLFLAQQPRFWARR
ncbi:MAG TPA: FecR domain-containing protein, partial [Gallionellaceae bacterium]|nr:FecR domain-containing protein [Gallionellaceae bacterium]